MTAIARWCFRRRLLVIATWVIALIGLGALAHGVSPTRQTYDLLAVTPVAARAGTEVIEVIPRTSPEDKATSDLIAALRGAAIPAAEHGTTLLVHVGGIMATFADFASFAVAKLARFLVTIVVLIFHLLVVAFRSLLIPATAALVNLIAAAAAFRVLIGFFQ